MERFSTGDTVTLSNTFQVDGTNTDPTGVTLEVTKPDLTTTTYSYAAAEISKISTGVYEKELTVDQAGNWLYVWEGTGAVEAVEDGGFRVFPAADTTVYATINMLKDRVGIAATDTNDDAKLQQALDAASRHVDDYCDRFFYDSGNATAKTFKASDSYELDVVDFSTTTGLVVATDENDDGTFEITWASTDWQVEPLDPKPGWPYNRLVAVGDYVFPKGSRRGLVRVTARWGWDAPPEPVREATLILASELFKLKDAPFGVAGFGDFGAVRVRDNPKVASLLDPYRRFAAMVA